MNNNFDMVEYANQIVGSVLKAYAANDETVKEINREEQRHRLEALIRDKIDPFILECSINELVDYLIENGVSVK